MWLIPGYPKTSTFVPTYTSLTLGWTFVKLDWTLQTHLLLRTSSLAQDHSLLTRDILGYPSLFGDIQNMLSTLQALLCMYIQIHVAAYAKIKPLNMTCIIIWQILQNMGYSSLISSYPGLFQSKYPLQGYPWLLWLGQGVAFPDVLNSTGTIGGCSFPCCLAVSEQFELSY